MVARYWGNLILTTRIHDFIHLYLNRDRGVTCSKYIRPYIPALSVWPFVCMHIISGHPSRQPFGYQLACTNLIRTYSFFFFLHNFSFEMRLFSNIIFVFMLVFYTVLHNVCQNLSVPVLVPVSSSIKLRVGVGNV